MPGGDGKHAGRQRDGKHEGRRKPLDAPRIEARQECECGAERHLGGQALQQRGHDDVARDCEENVDTGEPARQPRLAHVECNDCDDGDGAETIDMRKSWCAWLCVSSQRSAGQRLCLELNAGLRRHYRERDERRRDERDHSQLRPTRSCESKL